MKRGAGEFPTAPTTKEVGAILAGWVATGLDAKAGGGADRVGSIAIGELQARFGKTVDVWGLVKAFGVIGPDVHVAEVVNEDENIRLGLQEGRRRERQEEGQFHSG